MIELERRNYPAIAKATNESIEKVSEATGIVLDFEPKPGRGFQTIDNAQYITPDIFVAKVGDEYIISLNEDGMPKVEVLPADQFHGVHQQEQPQSIGPSHQFRSMLPGSAHR
jgi:DNA-directed RNA polymerase specialized sigma54-like protein